MIKQETIITMNVTDNELRGIVLKKYYKKRQEGRFQWQSQDFIDVQADFDQDDLYRICEQLHEHGLIEWKGIPSRGRIIGGIGKITARGVDVVEGTTPAPISMKFDNSRNISITSSSHVQIGDGNTQDIHLEVERLITAIDNSNAPEAEKQEAKSLLSKFLEHPVVAAIVGGLASTLKPPGSP